MVSDRRTDWTSRRQNVPYHLAIIMDGNRRWAEANGLSVHEGHRAGARNLRAVARACVDAGIKCLTIFAFSTENWTRPTVEVNLLFGLMRETLFSELDELDQRGTRLKLLGDLEKLPPDLRQLVAHATERTKDNNELFLNIALNYGGRWDIVNAASSVVAAVEAGEFAPEELDEATFARFLSLGDCTPAPDLCIRTGGEKRLSNFILWDLAYTELYFADEYWPDFGAEKLQAALDDFASRHRRFGARRGLPRMRVRAI